MSTITVSSVAEQFGMKEALELLENIYPVITLSFGENIPELLDWRDDIDMVDWELED